MTAGASYSRRFQLLSCDVVLRAECSGLGSQLDYLVQHATTDWPTTRSFEIDVRSPAADGRYRVYYDGRLAFEHHEPSDIVFLIFGDLYREAGRGLEDQINLHAASLLYRGRRVLAFGSSGAGKTTLAMMALGRDGWCVEGDDRVFLRDGLVMACPRRFHIKEEGFKSLPELEPELRHLPQLMGDGRAIYAFDPSEFGHEWHIGRGPAAAVIQLQRDAARTSENAHLETCSKVDMVRLLTHHASPAPQGRQDCLHQLAKLADSAACYRLEIGDSADSLIAIEAVLP